MSLNGNRIKSPKAKYTNDFLLLLTALIWGLAFVAQRAGMEYIGPFLFNGIRFALGALTLLPFIILTNNRDTEQTNNSLKKPSLWKGGFIIGLVLFVGASLQQAGMVYTTAGNAGFITSLYVIFVPLFGLLLKVKVHGRIWIGAIIALIGLYLLSVTDDFKISPGDFLVLLSAIFWAIHVLVISRYSPGNNPLKLAALQFVACSSLSFLIAAFTEPWIFEAIIKATIPILYGGIMSVGIGYTLQVVAQRKAHPASAAIILSLESLFAVLGGWIILDEYMTTRGIIGCGLMLTGVIISQYKSGNTMSLNLNTS